jgi:hypothetical protein
LREISWKRFKNSRKKIEFTKEIFFDGFLDIWQQ